MMDLKTVVLLLLNGEEVVVEDDLHEYYTVVLEKLDKAVDFSGDTTLLIRADRMEG